MAQLNVYLRKDYERRFRLAADKHAEGNLTEMLRQMIDIVQPPDEHSPGYQTPEVAAEWAAIEERLRTFMKTPAGGG